MSGDKSDKGNAVAKLVKFPTFSGDEEDVVTVFKTYKRDLKLAIELMEAIGSKDKKICAMLMRMNLSGRAREAVESLTESEREDTTEMMDELSKPIHGWTRVASEETFMTFMQFKTLVWDRKETPRINDHVDKAQRVIKKLKEKGFSLPPGFSGMWLLSTLGATDEEMRGIKTMIGAEKTDQWTFDFIGNRVVSYFGSSVIQKPELAIKTETVYWQEFTDDQEQIWYAKGGKGGKGGKKGGKGGKGQGQKGGKERQPYCFKCGDKSHMVDKCPHATNVCYTCKDPNHQSWQCPKKHAPEVKPEEKKKDGDIGFVTSQMESNCLIFDLDDADFVLMVEAVQEMGEIGRCYNLTVSNVLAAVIDTGATDQVVGSNTLKKIQQELKLHNMSVKVKQVQKQFRTAGGPVVSKYAASIPMVVNGQKGYVVAHVVEGETPLLLGLPALKKAKCKCIDVVGKRAVMLNCEVPLVESNSGLLLMPLL